MGFSNLLNTLSGLALHNTIILVIVSALTIAFIVDTSIIKISDLSSYYQLSFSSWKIVTFSIISAIYVMAQYLILTFVKAKNRQIWSKGKMLEVKLVHRLVVLVQYVMTAFLVGVILQMVVLSYYNVGILTAATTISYLLGITMMILLAHRFFLWFKSNRNLVVLFYGLSAAALSVKLEILKFLLKKRTTS